MITANADYRTAAITGTTTVTIVLITATPGKTCVTGLEATGAPA
jgi:hypothetical protein